MITITPGILAEVTASLFCRALQAKNESIEPGFQALVNKAPGRRFGDRLVNWALNKTDTEIPDDVKIACAWHGVFHRVGSAIETMIEELAPTQSTMTKELVIEWINRRGGIDRLHRDYFAHCNRKPGSPQP